jgi:hypothetical protein
MIKRSNALFAACPLRRNLASARSRGRGVFECALDHRARSRSAGFARTRPDHRAAAAFGARACACPRARVDRSATIGSADGDIARAGTHLFDRYGTATST